MFSCNSTRSTRPPNRYDFVRKIGTRCMVYVVGYRTARESWGPALADDQSFSMITFAFLHDPRSTGNVLPAGRRSRRSLIGAASQRIGDAPPYLRLEIGLGGKQRTNPHLFTVSLRSGGVRSKRTGRIMFPVAAEGHRYRSSDGVRITSGDHSHHGVVRIHLPHPASALSVGARDGG